MSTVPHVPNQRVQELYERFGPFVYSRCRRLVRDEFAAEDATQEVFLRALRHIASAPDDDGVLRWLAIISRNYCLNVLRNGAHTEVAVDEVPEGSVDGFEESFISRDLTERIMRSAPQHLQAPVQLYHVRGMEQTDIARALGISRRTVIYRLKEFAERARKLSECSEVAAA